jgi:hypothetical protein
MEKKTSERTAEEILNDLDTYQKVADKDLDVLPIRLRPSHEIAAREAKEKLVLLKVEYRQRLLANSLGLFTNGGAPGAQERFAEVSTGEGLLAVDANSLYMQLAQKIEPAIGRNREFTVDHLLILHGEMMRVRMAAGFNPAIELPTLAAIATVPTTAALANYVRSLIVKAGAGIVNGLYVANTMVAAAEAKRFKGRTFAVVVINSSEIDREHLAPNFSRTDLVDLEGVAPEAIDGGFAIGAFKAAKKKAV